MGQPQIGGMCWDAPSAAEKIKTIPAAPCVARQRPSNLTGSMNLWSSEFREQELLLPGARLSDDMVDIAFRTKCPEVPTCCSRTGKTSTPLWPAVHVELLLSSSQIVSPAPQQASWQEDQVKPAVTLPDAKHEEQAQPAVTLPDAKHDEDDFLGRYEVDLDFSNSRVPDAFWPDEKSSTSELCASHEDLAACERRPTKSVTSLTQWYDDAFSNASTLETISPESNSDESSTFSLDVAGNHDATGSCTEVFFLFDPSGEEEN